jgi:predicted  nucleic acid-binding Zn-ribbon protein
VSLDDLLPTNAPRDSGPRPDPTPEPVATPEAPEAPEAPAAPEAPPLTPTATAPRTPTAADRVEIERLHADVHAASEACERSPFGTLGRKRLRTAERAEADALERLGFASHADFVAATRAQGTATVATGDEVWTSPPSASSPSPAAPPAPRAGSFAALADLNTPSVATPEPTVEDESAPTDLMAELVLAQSALEQTQAELATAQTAKQATDAELAAARTQLAEGAAGTQAAEVARRHLSATEAELQRVRTELTQVTTARFSDGDAVTRLRAESEQELERMRAAAATEVTELAARLTAFENETARATEILERNHRDELVAVQAELAAARETAQRTGTEANDAVRSRDVAIDELARYRAEIDKLRGELGTARAESGRLQDDRDALLARATEAEAALGSARADSDLDVSRLDAATREHEAQIAELKAQLGQASIAANELSLAQGDLSLVRDELEIARVQVTSAHELTEQMHTELQSVRTEIDAARVAQENAQAERDAARVELAAMAAEVSTLHTTIEDLESRVPAFDGATDDLRRLVEVAQQLASGDRDDRRPRPMGSGRSRDEAELELAALEASVAKLRSKRRRMKRRIEEGRSQLRDVREAVSREVRDGEADRARIREETEALAARIALETASALDEAVRDRRAAHLARHAAIEHAGAELAALEAGVETVAIDANALRSKLASIRTELLSSPDPEADASEEHIDR